MSHQEIFIESEDKVKTDNQLFPVFFKLNNLRLLIVGAGKIGFEKLQTVLQNSPDTKICIVAKDIRPEVEELAAKYSNISISQKVYDASDLDDADIAIVAVNDQALAEEIRADANEKGKLLNVADKPSLCDFYLGSVVKKGSLKIAISTNGKSPTIAKRLKDVLNDMIPVEMENVLDNMQTIRNGIHGDFDEKVKQLNELTNVLVAKRAMLVETNKPGQKKWQQIVKWILFAFFFMILGHSLLSYIPLRRILEGFSSLPQYIDTRSFLMMLVTGFLAQMTDGSLGMGYGTISTTLLLAMGVNPAIVSSRVHTARVFSSGVSGYSHHRFGNINRKLFKIILIPGVIGAIIGAALAFHGQEYATKVRIPLSLYTIYLGYYILRKAFSRNRSKAKVKGAGWLAATGGFMDAFAGGGWGTLVTSTLLSKRKTPRYVIGSVCLAEFFVVLTSSITFFILLKSIPLFDVAGLIIGGLIAAPIAARLVGRIPLKTTFIIVGIFVMLTSISTLWKAFVAVLH